MPSQIRLLALSAAQPGTIRFQLVFASPGDDEQLQAAQASVEPGDGGSSSAGVICAPSPFDWRRERVQELITHRYAQPGPFVARVSWGDVASEITVAPGALDSAQPPVVSPELVEFDVVCPEGRSLERTVRIRVVGLESGLQLRLDGGAGQVCWPQALEPASDGEDSGLAAPAAPDPDQEVADTGAGVYQLSYAKPGVYTVALDLLDRDGFWIATLVEKLVQITLPGDDEESSRKSAVAGPYVAASDSPAPDLAQSPWLPFRYARPVWGWLRTYTAAGGKTVSRVLALGTYLGIRAEEVVGGSLWYQTAARDWVAASGVEFVRPSSLRGIALGGSTVAQQHPVLANASGQALRAVVTASLLNVRARPGLAADNPPVDQLNAGASVPVFDEVVDGGTAWYRIGLDRWVQGGHTRTFDEALGSATVRGVATASLLNVRRQPGIHATNPPVDQIRAGSMVPVYQEREHEGITWYRIGPERWVTSAHVRLVEDGLLGLAGVHAALQQLPVGWVTANSLNVRARPGIADNNPPVGRVGHYEVVPVLETQVLRNANWYRIGEDRWVEGRSIAVARARARPAAIAAQEKWVGVSLREQTAVAYQGDTPVYAALVATGLPGTPTVQGIYRTYKRVPWGKMSGGSAASGSYYFLEDVTWTCYFYSGYSLHTAYWHDVFGSPRSHGCVNLTPYDAWWMYQWSDSGEKTCPAVYVYY